MLTTLEPKAGRGQGGVPIWAKPFAAVWRARVYFSAALIFWALSSTIPVPFAEQKGEALAWWQVLIDKAFGSFDKISYASFFAGLVYAVLSDTFDHIWNMNLQKELATGFMAFGETVERSLISFTTGLTGMSFEAVKVWVEGKRGSPEQMRIIGLSSLKSYYGPHNFSPNGLIDFVTDEIIDNSAFSSSQTWEGFVTSVTIRNGQIPDHFEWEERKNYDILCGDLSEVVSLNPELSMKIDRAHVARVISEMDYKIDLNRKAEVDFREWWKKNGVDADKDHFKVEADGCVLEYDGLYLYYRISLKCKIHQERTPIVIYERSFISQQDRCFTLAVRQPTRGLQASLSLEGIEDWTVKTPTASASLYKRGEQIVTTESQRRRTASARIRGWTLPGIALVIEWGPT